MASALGPHFARWCLPDGKVEDRTVQPCRDLQLISQRPSRGERLRCWGREEAERRQCGYSITGLARNITQTDFGEVHGKEIGRNSKSEGNLIPFPCRSNSPSPEACPSCI